ncbi:MAG TPA: AI-2E family transporter [Acidimicrobiia bacterium]|nr:AI-2E family transporter [Acidimicrobiia bacterium]
MQERGSERQSESSPDRPEVAPSEPLGAWPRPGYWVKVAVAVIAIVLALRITFLLQGVLLVLLASLVLALGLQPAIEYLEERGMSRGWALTLIIGIVNIVLVAGAIVVIPMAANQLDAIGAAIPEVQEELRELGGLGEIIADRIDPSALVGTEEEEVTRTLGTAAATLFNLFTVAVLVPYFAHALPRMKRWVLRLIRREERPDLLSLLNEASERISGYILGNSTVSLLAGVISFFGLWALGVDYPLILAVWIALTDLIPIVGAFIGAIPAVAVAARQGLGLVVAVAVFLLAYQLFENYVVSPRIMTRAIDLSPAAVIVAVMVGGTLAGVTGALLALPLAAMVKVAMEQYVISTRLETVRADTTTRMPTRRRGRSRPLP